MSHRSRLAVALAAAAFVAAAAGCSSPKPGSSASTTTTSKSLTGATAVPTNVPNDVRLRANVQIGLCKAVPGGWEATGTAVNPETSSITYVITIFFTTSQATVIAVGNTSVTVKAGARSPWTVSRSFAAPAGTLCVLRGVG